MNLHPRQIQIFVFKISSQFLLPWLMESQSFSEYVNWFFLQPINDTYPEFRGVFTVDVLDCY